MTTENEPMQAAEDAVSRLLSQIAAEASNLQGVVVGYVRKDGNAAVRWTPMSAPMLSHLSRILDLKVDRQYVDGMQQAAAPVRAPVSSPISKAVKRAADQARQSPQSPADKLQARERSRNKSKVGKTKA